MAADSNGRRNSLPLLPTMLLRTSPGDVVITPYARPSHCEPCGPGSSWGKPPTNHDNTCPFDPYHRDRISGRSPPDLPPSHFQWHIKGRRKSLQATVSCSPHYARSSHCEPCGPGSNQSNHPHAMPTHVLLTRVTETDSQGEAPPVFQSRHFQRHIKGCREPFHTTVSCSTQLDPSTLHLSHLE